MGILDIIWKAMVELCWFTPSAGLPRCSVQTFAVTYDTEPRNAHQRVPLKQEEVLHHNGIKGYEGLVWFHYQEKLGLRCGSGTFHSTSESSQRVQRQQDFRLSNPLTVFSIEHVIPPALGWLLAVLALNAPLISKCVGRAMAASGASATAQRTPAFPDKPP